MPSELMESHWLSGWILSWDVLLEVEPYAEYVVERPRRSTLRLGTVG